MQPSILNHSSAIAQSRRQFLKTSLLGGLGLPLIGRAASDCCGGEFMFTQMGVNAPLSSAEVVDAAGADYLLVTVGSFLMPNEPEAAFEKQLARLKRSPLPVLSCNGFLGGGPTRSVGPDARHENVLKFAETAFRRAKRAGVKYIVFGSCGSRHLPKGWTKAQADEQFIALLKQMGPIAGKYGVIVAVENLQAKECNYLTLFSEVGEIVTTVNHPNIRALADLYHASSMNEPPENFAKYAKVTAMVEIAEKKGRTVPGVSGQDFSPYFKALKKGGYRGPIEIEGRWKPEQLPNAFATIREQAS